MKTHPTLTLLQTIDQYPPFLVYALSRTGSGGPAAKRKGYFGTPSHLISKRLPVDELAARAGLSVRTFSRIASRISWGTVQAVDIDAFSKGCGINLFQMRDHMDYIKKAGANKKQDRWPHLSPTQWRRFCMLWKRWKASGNGSVTA